MPWLWWHRVKHQLRRLRGISLFLLFLCAISLNTTWFFRGRTRAAQHPHVVPKPRPMPLKHALADPVVIATMTVLPSGAEQHNLNISGCSWQVGWRPQCYACKSVSSYVSSLEGYMEM